MSRMKSHRAKSQPRNQPTRDPWLRSPSTRATETHIFFWKGWLSNWDIDTPRFPGARWLELLLPDLDRLNIIHPPHDAVSTRLLAEHMFNCGEQAMMAMKGWLFERDIQLMEMPVDAGDVGDQVSSSSRLSENEFPTIREHLLAAKPQTDWAAVANNFDQSLYLASSMTAAYESTLCRILRNNNPRQQKAIGRNARGFNEEIWIMASKASTTAALVARAEVDSRLRAIYMGSAGRRFVEGSPSDKIWGVKLKWDDPRIEDESNWQGENRLGLCHDQAAAFIQQNFSGD